MQDKLTNSPLSLLSRGQTEDILLVSSVRFIVRFNVYRELLYKGTGIPETQENSLLDWNGNENLKDFNVPYKS